MRSIAGSAFSSAPVLSVILNSRKALRWTMALARAGSVMPASSTTIRLSPTFWTSGSSTPNSSIRFRSTVKRQVEILLGIGGDLFGLIQLEGEMHPALKIEAPLERHPGDGRRRA